MSLVGWFALVVEFFEVPLIRSDLARLGLDRLGLARLDLARLKLSRLDLAKLKLPSVELARLGSDGWHGATEPPNSLLENGLRKPESRQKYYQ